MKDKIFQALKQDYPQLGLGDEVLMARAEALAATGLVTDENLKTVVASQKANLEALQKSNDKRVADALAKARKEAEEAAAKASTQHAAALKAEQDKLTALQKEYEEFKSKHPGNGSQETGEIEKRLKEQVDAQLAEVQKTIKSLTEANKTYSDQLKKMQDEKDAAAKAAAAAARKTLINTKATEAGIPQWRIDEGFVIPEEYDETKIGEAMAGIAANIKKQMLPGRTAFSRSENGDAAISKEDATNIVKGILHR